MSTATHPLQNALIADSAMTAFFLLFVVFLFLAAGSFAAGLSVRGILGDVEIASTTVAAALSAAVSLFFAVLAILLATVFA